MNLIHQFTTVFYQFISPKKAFRSLPSNQWYLLAWITPLFFGVSLAFDPRFYTRGLELCQKPWILLLTSALLSLAVFLAFMLIVQQAMTAFGKWLTLRKVMNVCGYALVPGILAYSTGHLLMLKYPAKMASETGLNGVIVLATVLPIVGLTFSVALFFYGVAVQRRHI